jgi:MFS family permease
MSRPLPPLDYQEKHVETGAGVWSAQHRRLTLGLILITLGPAFEGLAVATILPKVVADLGGLSFYGWAFSAYMLATFVGIILAGSEADRRGPALPFIAGVVLFVLGLIMAGAASSMLMLVLSRGVQGFGAGLLASVAFVCVGRGYPEAVKPRMLAVLSSAWVVPGLIGPALAGVVADLAGWRWVFLGLVPVLPLATGLTLPALRQLTPAVTSGSFDARRLVAAVGLVIGTAMTLTGLQMGSLPVAAVLVLVGLALGIPSLQRLLPPGTLRAKAGLPAAIATLGFLSMAFFGGEAFLPLTLISIRGQSLFVAGVALTAATLTWTAGAWVQAQLAPRRGRRLLVTSGLMLLVTGLAGIASVLIAGIPVVVAPVAWGVAGLGMGLAYSTLSLVVLETAPAQQQGSASSSMQLSSVLGSALGTGLGGVIVGLVAMAGGRPGSGILTVDILVIVVTGLAVLTAVGLPGPPVQGKVESESPVL